MPALLLVGHGSLLRGFDTAMKRVARVLRKNQEFSSVSCAYLEITPPSIEAGIRKLVQAGAKEVVVVPYFLLTGKHVTRHIPAIVKAARKEHKGKAGIKLAPYLGYDKKIADIVGARAKEAR
ncbi:MAG: CbiX/SirB N-terminal domain-containing protein [Candidatus Omnitrophica bacterium]|nr:CbiX/SirB N-terminal domain-containing protein [Candidatus Omnitrophota bacterium]